MSSGSDPRYDAEKNAAFTSDHDIPSEHYTEGLGDLQVLKVGSNADLKLAKDGKTVLIPQPSDDPNDPVRWNLYSTDAFHNRIRRADFSS